MKIVIDYNLETNAGTILIGELPRIRFREPEFLSTYHPELRYYRAYMTAHTIIATRLAVDNYKAELAEPKE